MVLEVIEEVVVVDLSVVVAIQEGLGEFTDGVHVVVQRVSVVDVRDTLLHLSDCGK